MTGLGSISRRLGPLALSLLALPSPLQALERPKGMPGIEASLTDELGQKPKTASQHSLLKPELEARIEALLAQMSLEEKIGQLNQASPGEPIGPSGERLDFSTLIKGGHVGSLLNLWNPKQIEAYQKIAVEQSRLHIPILFGLDVIHGYRTTFPIPLGLSCAWDPALIESASRVAAQETSAQGIRWTFSPMVDIARDARWGRIAESAGEDPYLGSVLARAYVRGYQGTRLDEPSSILACAKHFVGYGAAEAGRDYNSTEISERTLRQVYLPPFQAAVQEGAGTLMAAFNAISGVPASGNAFTMSQVLRKEWGFQGLVVSDWDSVHELVAHGVALDDATAAGKALNAGLDMDMGSILYLRNLPALVKSGAVSTARLDEAVRRVLRLKLALGLFEHPYSTQVSDPAAPLSEEKLLLARRAAEASFVLLRNEPVNGKPLLPLKAHSGLKLALIGPHGDDAQQMLGSWSIQGRAQDVTTLRTSLEELSKRSIMSLRVAKGTGLTDASETGFAEALEAAKASDVVLMALGEDANATGEATSRTRLDLPGAQQKLLEAVVGTGKPVVLILFNGRPLALPWADRHVPAILEAWYPGNQAGQALLRTLFGAANPSGRLTVTVPRAVGQEPLYYNALSTGRPAQPDMDLTKPPVGYGASRWVSRYIDETNAPLYPFGHGLSYTTFDYSPVACDVRSLSAKAIEGGASFTVQAMISNTGTCVGTETVQCYIRLRGTSVARPVRELKAFERVELGPGQKRLVTFRLGREALAFWNLDLKEAVEPTALSVWIAPDSASGQPLELSLSK